MGEAREGGKDGVWEGEKDGVWAAREGVKDGVREAREGGKDGVWGRLGRGSQDILVSGERICTLLLSVSGPRT